MPNICVRCVKDTHLKSLINNEGAVGECSLCGSHDSVMDTENNRFFQLTKALVRFYYSEWDYNTHWGGDGYESLFYGESNRFFCQDRSSSDEAYEDIVLSITEGPVYEDYDKGISIFSGYDADGNQNPLLQSISTDLDRNILTIEQRLKIENYFNLENDIKNILEKYRDTASTPIINNTFLYRGRVGYKEKKRSIALGFETEFHYVPYKDSEISSPPPNSAMSGRVNRAGVSFLYCATDKYTAVAEVRPHPGDRVSLAKLCTKQDVQVYDLSDTKLLNFFESDEVLDKYKPLNTLGVLINKTIPPAERSHYSITQLISDCIRQIGFDGIMFNSTVGEGKNIVLFDRAFTEQVHDAAEVVLIESVKYEYSQEIIVTDDEDYL